MEKCRTREYKVEQIGDQILIYFSTEETCFSFLLEPEDARNLSSILFGKFVAMTILNRPE